MRTILIFTIIFILSVQPIFASTNDLELHSATEPASIPASIPVSIHTSAQASALIDVKSGRVLMSHRGDEPLLIASLTKIMTAIVAIEQGRLSDLVTVNQQAYRKEGSSLYLQLGEQMSLEHMLYGLMLRSGNDAAEAIAEHVGGSLQGFAYMMNEKAQVLGMTNSHFVNPHGLNVEGHYSSANDMAKLTAYALKHPVFSNIVKTKIKKVPNPYQPWDYVWRNKNKMLFLYEGGDGVKTGYTKLAGRCLVSSATRNGRQLAVVTLNAPSDWLDHKEWLNYGFEQFEQKTLIEKQSNIKNTAFVAGRTFRYPLREEEENQISFKSQLTDPNSAHFKLGERGTLHILLSEDWIGSIPIYEMDSHRLELKSSPAFMFNETKVNEVYLSFDNYYSVLKIMVKSLFLKS